MVRERLIAEPGVIKLHDVEVSLPGRASCRARGKNPSQSACSQSSPCSFTRPTRFELVWWIRRLPSLVTQKFRMMPTPEGIVQLWNFSVFGSNRTRASGLIPDSLYQITSLMTAKA